MSEAPAIGIDLGTVNSCMAACRKLNADAIVTEIIQHQDERITPSTVFYSPEGDDVLVGHAAVDEIFSHVENGVYDSKRFIGRNFLDSGIQSIYENYPFKIDEGPNESILIKVDHKGKVKSLKPEDVSAEILKSFKKRASDYFGQDVTEAVITVPAYFTNSQREATKKAAEIAGLKVLNLMNEPTAAALYYFSDGTKDNLTAMVFDLGGGTLDISIIRLENKKISVKSVIGDTFLGGRNFDDKLLKYFCNSIKRPDIDNIQFLRIKEAVESIKKKITSKTEAAKVLPNLYGTEKECLRITKEKFESLNKKLFQKCVDIIQQALQISGFKKTDIDEVVLVGGSTRIPKIQELISQYFDGKALVKDLNPDEAVAAGAAIQAAMLKKTIPQLYKVIDIIPLSLGVASYGKKMEFMIKRNSPIPIEAKSSLCTADNDQEGIPVDIFEGERPYVKFNNPLGHFVVTGLPKGRAGDIIVDITFKINENGILEVTAEESSSGVKNQLMVEANKFNFHGENIRAAVEDAEKNKEIDKQFLLYRNAKSDARMFCIKYLYNKEENSTTEKVKDFIKKLDESSFELKAELPEVFEDFLKSVDDDDFEKEEIEHIRRTLIHI